LPFPEDRTPAGIMMSKDGISRTWGEGKQLDGAGQVKIYGLKAYFKENKEIIKLFTIGMTDRELGEKTMKAKHETLGRYKE
jgi:hypothetical protein